MMIEPDSPEGLAFGFTADKFHGWLWHRADGIIIISMIISLQPNQGHCSKFIDDLVAAGHTIWIPTPMGYMMNILKKRNFYSGKIYDEQFGEHVLIYSNKEIPSQSK